MNNQSYEEYIRSIIGYPTNNTYSSSLYENNYISNNINYNNNESIIEKCYPKIYRMINPMVEKICSQNTKPITENLINDMTKEIYFSLENETEINLNVNLSNNIRGNTDSSNTKRTIKENKEVSSSENRQFNPRNPILNDLIKILVIKELLRKNQNRPPFPEPRPQRPPFPSEIPPLMQRNYQKGFDFYQY